MSENILNDNDNIFTAEDLSVGYEKTHKERMTDLKLSLIHIYYADIKVYVIVTFIIVKIQPFYALPRVPLRHIFDVAAASK